MSTSAMKSSSIPGVGTSPPTSGILPMNVVAQKVLPGGEPGAMKPLGGNNLSYVTLQPASQPLSLVQDHRSQIYQSTYSTTNISNERDDVVDKSITNGVDNLPKIEHPDSALPAKQNQDPRNNNLSPETPVQEESKPELQITTATADSSVLGTPPSAKIEDKKSPINNGSKESETSPATVTTSSAQSKKSEETTPIKSDNTQKSKSTTPTKSTSESSPTSTTKSDQKPTSSIRPSKRKSRELKDLKGLVTEGGSKPKRNRVQTQPYQSPLPEFALIVKTLTKQPQPNKNADDRLIVFYKNEFLAVRNAEGSFYVCQAMQNIFKSSRRIRIRWLSQDKNNGEIYSPDFYDFTDFDCILTNLNLYKVDKNKYQLTKCELLRTENILKRAIDVEAGVSEKPSVTEEHPDGLDLSLYKDESQLKKRKNSTKPKQRQRKRSKHEETSSSSSSSSSGSSEDESSEDEADKLPPKSPRLKNKALAIAKSVANSSKVSNRAKRTPVRGNKVNSNNNANSTTSSTTTTTATTTTTTTKTTTDNGKRDNIDSKKIDTKKQQIKQTTPTTNTSPTTTNTTTTVTTATNNPMQRTKLRGSGQTTEESSKTSGRVKRAAAGGGGGGGANAELTSPEELSSRKKTRKT